MTLGSLNTFGIGVVGPDDGGAFEIRFDGGRFPEAARRTADRQAGAARGARMRGR